MTFREADVGLFIAHAYKFNSTTSTFIVECPPETWRRSGLDRMSVAFEHTRKPIVDEFQEAAYQSLTWLEHVGDDLPLGAHSLYLQVDDEKQARGLQPADANGPRVHRAL